MGETNLFEETVYIMTTRNKTWEDINWIGGHDFYVDVETFIKAAKQTYYDNGYGGQEVAGDLVICFNDGSWLSRAEYDGSEWWQYNYYPQQPIKKFNNNNLKLTGYMWDTLKEINYPEERNW